MTEAGDTTGVRSWRRRPRRQAARTAGWLLAALAAAGCTAGSDPTAPPADRDDGSVAWASAAPPTTDPGMATAPAEADAHRLVFWIPDAWLPERGNVPQIDGTALGGAIEAFASAHPDAAVDVRVRPSSGAAGMLPLLASTQAVSPARLPDLAALPLDAVPGAAAAGIVQPWSEVDAAAVVTDTFPFAAAQAVSGGVAWGIPVVVDVAHAVSRLAEAPTRWPAGEGGAAPMVWPAGGATLPDLAPTLALYAASGGDLAQLPAPEPTALAATLDLLAEGVGRGAVVPPASGASPRAAWNTFVTRDVPVAATSGGVFAPLQAKFPGLSWGPLPGPSRPAPPVAWGWAFVAVARDPDAQRRALALADWLADRERVPWMIEAGYLPARRIDWAARLADASDPAPSEAYTAFLEEQLAAARTVQGSATWSATWSAAAGGIISGGSVEAALSRWQGPPP